MKTFWLLFYSEQFSTDEVRVRVFRHEWVARQEQQRTGQAYGPRSIEAKHIGEAKKIASQFGRVLK